MFVMRNYVEIYQGECPSSYSHFNYIMRSYTLVCWHSSCVAGWAGVDLSPLPNLEYDGAVHCSGRKAVQYKLHSIVQRSKVP